MTENFPRQLGGCIILRLETYLTFQSMWQAFYEMTYLRESPIHKMTALADVKKWKVDVEKYKMLFYLMLNGLCRMHSTILITPLSITKAA